MDEHHLAQDYFSEMSCCNLECVNFFADQKVTTRAATSRVRQHGVFLDGFS